MPVDVGIPTIEQIMKTPQYKRELALCKKAGGDIAAIFNLKLDLQQLTEVRKGLESNVDVSKYMKPELHWTMMREYRLEMEQNTDLTKYIKEKYNIDQLEQLRLGMAAGVDITQYDSKSYSAEQMKQLRMGLEEGIPIIFFADSAFDHLQMEELRRGLEDHLDISSYASSDIPFLKMRAIRECLAENIEVNDMMIHKWDARVLREWHLAKVRNIDLTDYIRLGFDADQLEQIRIAKEENLYDFDRFLMPEMRGAGLEQIRLGIKAHIDVLAYANGMYNWKQMQEIRLGMEKGLDVSIYSNPKFHCGQMRELRLGLESNIDVSQYSSFMYTAEEMHKLRLWMEAGKILPDDKREVFDDLTLRIEKFKKNKNDVDWEFLKTSEGSMISVSDDLMNAYVTLSPMGDISRYTTDYVMTLLFKARIRRGVMRQAIDEIISEHQFGVRMKVAEGKAPVDGQDGSYEVLFNRWISTDPEILEDGTADFGNILLFEETKMGDKLVIYHKAGVGEDGFTVTGQPLPAKKGKDLPPLTGKGFILLNDKCTYVSAFNGVVRFDDSKLDVAKLDVITNETYNKTAPEYPGCVVVKCDLSPGMIVKAVGDILVEGNMKRASLRAGGNIVIKGECKGENNDRCSIIAGGIVAAKKFDTVDIDAKGCVMSTSCVGCKIKTRDKVVMLGDNGVISGGTIDCINGVEASVIGNKYKRETVITIGVSSDVLEEYEKVKEQIRNIQDEMKVMSQNIEKFNSSNSSNQSVVQMKIKVKMARSLKEKELTDLLAKRIELEKKVQNTTGATVMVSNIAYMGTLISIDGFMMRLHENMEKYGGLTFYREGKQILVK